MDIPEPCENQAETAQIPRIFSILRPAGDNPPRRPRGRPDIALRGPAPPASGWRDSQPAYDPDDFWRGMIWGPVNRLVVDALERCGQTNAADRLRTETLRLFETDGRFHEVYDPVSGRGRRGVLMSGFGAGVYLYLLGWRLSWRTTRPEARMSDA